jgi:hypothetical protein
MKLWQNSIQIAKKGQGTTSQVAEKLKRSFQKRQGMTSVVPKTQRDKRWALAPAYFYFSVVCIAEDNLARGSNDERFPAIHEASSKQDRELQSGNSWR